MKEHSISYNHIQLNEIDSTNNYLKQICNTTIPPEFTLVQANYQKAGKGQRGNYWESEPYKNLLFSFLLKPHMLPVKQQFLLSEIVSIALIQALSSYSSQFKIKWPNDIYWEDKKIAGILIEHDVIDNKIDYSIIGIGININQTSFKSDAPNPISLVQIINEEKKQHEILNLFWKHFQQLYETLKAGQVNLIQNQYKQYLYRSDSFYVYKDKFGLFEAKVHSVDTDGTFRIIDKQGKLRSYLFKEVQYII